VWTPDQIVENLYGPFPDELANGRETVQAAQDQLCPDTKH
jgi:hypothetical protein